MAIYSIYICAPVNVGTGKTLWEPANGLTAEEVEGAWPAFPVWGSYRETLGIHTFQVTLLPEYFLFHVFIIFFNYFSLFSFLKPPLHF